MKVYHLSSPKNTVWELDQQNFFTRISSPWQADVWVANQEYLLREQLEKAVVLNRKKPKACILWTHEPYFSTTTAKQKTLYDCPVHIFNVWNGGALRQNATFLLQNYPTSLPSRPQSRSEWRSQGKPVCALMTYPNTAATFTQERLTYALSGHQTGILDLYGKGWPPGYVVENSRDGEWWTSKPAIQAKYDYSLAMENCIQPYYVTEKLWDSILNGCLPIYCNNGTIYRDFERGSFFDVRDYRSPEQLWEAIQNMSLLEWNHRYSLCWDAMEALWKRYSESPNSFWETSILEIQATLKNLT
jgi:hypothetical protein